MHSGKRGESWPQGTTPQLMASLTLRLGHFKAGWKSESCGHCPLGSTSCAWRLDVVPTVSEEYALWQGWGALVCLDK